MFQLGRHSGFAEELLGFCRIELVLAGDSDGNNPVQFGVVCFPDGSERADAEVFPQLEMPDGLPLVPAVADRLLPSG